MSTSGPPETTIDSSQPPPSRGGFFSGSQCADGANHACGDCVRRVVRLSLVANVCGVILKFVVGFLAGSRALVADATHSLTDTLSYGINFSGSRLTTRKDAPPTLGSGLLIASITFLSGIAITAHNAAILLRGTHTRPGLLGIVVAAISVGVNARLYIMARCATRRSDDHSAYVCLVQVRTDVIASSLTFASMLAASLGLLVADPLCALTIGCVLIVSAISIYRSTMAKTQRTLAWIRALRVAVGAGALAIVIWVAVHSRQHDRVVLVPSQGATLDSPVAPVLGLSPYYILADTTIGTVVPVIGGGWARPEDATAAILALTQMRDVNIVLAARIAPELFGALQAAQVRMYYLPSPMTVSQAVAAYLAGNLPPATEVVVEQGFGVGSSARWLQPW